MLAKPSTPANSVDPRLRALADPELSDRLIADHPQLYPTLDRADAELAQSPIAGTAEVEEPASSNDLWRMLAIAGLLLAVGAAYAFGVVMRARMNADIPPLVSLVPQSHPAAAKRVISRHDNLGPAAAAKLERTLAVVAQKKTRTFTRAMIASPLPKPHGAQTARARVLAEKMHTVATPRFHEEVSEARAPALVSSAASSEAQAVSPGSDAQASSDATASTESGSPGRQIPRGPVWSENGPGSIVPGASFSAEADFQVAGGCPVGAPGGETTVGGDWKIAPLASVD